MGVRLTADGRWYGLVVLGFTAASLNTGANLLLALAGGLLGVIAVNALLARRAVRGLVLGLDGPAQVAQGSPWRLTLRLSAANPRGCPLALRIRCPWSETPQALAGIPAGATLHLSLRPDAELPRGEHTLDGVQVACAAPFGLAEARAVARARHTLLVTPRVYPLRTGALERVERGEGNAAAAYLQGAEQRDRVRSLREFRAGDSPRAIHWRSSARRGSLVVREFERGVPERSCVVVSLAPGDPAAIDAALSLAASLHAALRARGERVGLALVGRASLWIPGEAPPQSALVALALASPSAARGVDLGAVARRLAGALPTRTWLISNAPEARLAGAARWIVREAADLDRWVHRPSLAPRPAPAEAL